MDFPRAAGVLVHPTSFPNRYGIGDLGPGHLKRIAEAFFQRGLCLAHGFLVVGPIEAEHQAEAAQQAEQCDPEHDRRKERRRGEPERESDDLSDETRRIDPEVAGHDDRDGRARARRLVQMVVSVRPRALECKERTTLDELPGVDDVRIDDGPNLSISASNSSSVLPVSKISSTTNTSWLAMSGIRSELITKGPRVVEPR